MEDFVTYEVAKKLKEKGFKFNKDYRLDRFFMANEINTPTIAQVLKWLREEKKLNVNVRLYIENGWYLTVQNYNGESVYSQFADTDELYPSYESAALAGINYTLDNLI